MTQQDGFRLHPTGAFGKIRRIFCGGLILFLAGNLLHAQILGPGSKESPDSNRTRFIKAARTYLGTAYISGGTTKTGMDCSGLIYRAALDGLDAQIPRTVSSLSRTAQQIPDLAREAGDLLFFNTTGNISHVGIYLGGSTFVHAASDGPRTGVIISDLGEAYWKKSYRYAARILAQEGLKMPGNAETAPSANPFPDPAPLVSINSFPFSGKIGLRANYTGGVLWDIMPGAFPVRGVSLNAEISWVKKLNIYPGIGAGFSWDERYGAWSFPVFASMTFPEGFRFFIGTQLHAFADKHLDKSPRFPGIIGASWNSPPASIFGQNFRFYQGIEYSIFPNETFGTGLRFNTGLTISFDI